MIQRFLILLLLGTLIACGGDHSSGTSATQTAGTNPLPPAGINRAPIANTDVIVVAVDTAIVIDVMANDTDPDGDPLRIIIVGQPANGTATLDDKGTAATSDDVIVYQPPSGYIGSDEFTYSISDGGNGSASGEVQITVGISGTGAENVAKSDSATTDSISVTIDVLANDTWLGVPQITAFSQGSHGTVTLDDAGTSDTSDDRLLYTPNVGFTGFDSFTYLLNNASPAVVNITVNDSVGGVFPAPASTGLSGRVIKGPVAAAVVKLFPMDTAGIEDRSAPVYQTVTDTNGYWTSPLPAQPGPLLIVSTGGYYYDEAHSNSASLPVRFETSEEWLSVLPAAETFAVTSLYSSAVLARARAESIGANFTATYAQVRATFALATGLDVVAVDPVDPANPDVTHSSAAAVAYGLLIGGAAESINQISLISGLSVSAYPVIIATIEDLTDCWLEGQSFTGLVSINLPSASVGMPTNINLNTQILRFRNNRANQYGGATLPQIDRSPCQVSGPVPDTSAPLFVATPPALVLGGGTAAGFPISDPRITAFLIGAVAVDDRDGPIAVSHNAPATFFIGDTPITFTATDNAGNTTTATATVTVNAAPSGLSIDNAAINENNAPGSVVGTLTTTDTETSDTHSYSLVSGAGDIDNALFSISGDAVLANVTADFEAQSSYSIRVQSTDSASGIVAEVISITVTDQNDAPSALLLDNSVVNENLTPGSPVGLLTSVDQDISDSHTYTLVPGPGDTDNALFTLSANLLQTAATFDFETRSTYSIRIETRDSVGVVLAQSFVITISDRNDSPTGLSIDTAVANEGVAPGTVVGNFSTTDVDATDTHIYMLVSGAGDTDNSQFMISGSTLVTNAPIDFEIQNSYSIRVQTRDPAGDTFTQVLVIAVNDGSDGPTAVGLDSTTLDENQPVGSLVGNLSTTDPDTGDTFTYALVSGAGDTGNAQFTITGNQLLSSTIFDFETQAVYSVRIQTTDGTGASFADVFTININDTNDGPTAVALDKNNINENQAIASVVGNLSSTDADTGDTFTYALVSGAGDTGNAQFTITGNQLLSSAIFDFETQALYSVRVQTTDGTGASFADVFTININDTNDGPTAVALDKNNINENQAIASVVGNLSSTDADTGDTFTYALVSGAGDTGNAQFSVVGNQLQSAAVLDFETQASYSVRIQTTDAAGASFADVFTITIDDVNDGPTALALDNNDIDENQAIATAVGNLSSTDADTGDTFTYALVSGAGDTGNAQFSVVGNQLQSAAVLDFETQVSYSVRIQTTDAAGATFSLAFAITINDVNDGPTAVALDNNDIDENQAIATAVGNLSSTDADTGDTFTYALVSGAGDTGNAQFSIVGNQLHSAAVFDFETQALYSIRIQTTDAAGATFASAFAITINDVNDGPTAVALDNNDIDENQAIATAVGNLSATDADTGDTFTYALVSGAGDTGNAQFSIVGNQLHSAAVFDFETQALYSIRIQTTDAAGATFASAFAITINDVNDGPTAVALDNNDIDENQAIATAVGNLSATDADTGDTFTYALVSGAGDTGNSQFSIIGNQLQSAAVFDFETQASYSVRIQTTDAAGATFANAFAITINDVNDGPTALALDNNDIDENQAIATAVGNLSSTDADTGDTFTYALVSGAGDTGNAQFSVVGNQLQSAAVLDFETQAAYSVRIQTTDAAGATFASAFAITVNDVNDGPTALALDNNDIDENQAIATAVGNLSSTDADTGDTFTYALVSGAGDTGNAQFSVVGNQLQSAAVLDFETQAAYSVRIQTTDAAGATFASAFAITINDVNDGPTAVALDNNDIDENQAIATAVGNLSSTDADTGDTFTYALVSGAGDTGNAQFSVVGNQLQSAAVLDFETQVSYSVRIQTTDAAGASHADVFTININNLPEAPNDTDSDGLTDPEEMGLQGTFAGDPACPFINNADSDGDKIGDGAEVRAGGNPCASDPSQTIYYVDPTGTWPGSTTNLPADPVPTTTAVPNYVLIQSGTYNSEISPTTACDNLHYIGSQDFSQPGQIMLDPVSDLPTTTIDMQNTRFSRADGCTNMVLQDLALTNGIGDAGRGGGMRAVNSATVVMERVHIHNNAANDQGGGIGVSNAGTIVEVRDSLIEYNTVDVEKGGGGAWVGNGATLNLKNTRIRGNAALGSGGGGLYFDHGTAGLIEDSWIIENTATGDGGGIEIDYTTGIDANISINNTVISGNSAGNEGGGIRINKDGAGGAVIQISNSQIYGNYAAGGGGGAYLRDSGTTVNLHNVLIVGNQSVSAGAGLAVDGAGTNPALQNLTLALNLTSAAAGGALAAIGGSPQISDSILWQNRAGARAFTVAPSSGDNYSGVTGSDFNLLEIDKIGVSDVDFVIDGVQPFFTLAYYLDQGLSPAINTGSDTAVNLGLATFFTGPVTDGGQVDRGYHYLDTQASPADDYQEIGGAVVNLVALFDAENGANADRLIIEPLLGGLPLGTGHQVVATLEGINIGLAQLIPTADIDPLSDGESALLVDQGDGTYAVALHAVGVAPGDTPISLRVFVDGVDLGVNVTVLRKN